MLLKIPNREIHECFELKLANLYSSSNPVWFDLGKDLLAHLLANETDNVRNVFNQLLTRFISIRTTGHEFYYHGFIHGILAMAASQKSVEIKADQETGEGYADIILSNQESGTVVIMEFKKGTNTDEKRLSAAENAAKQIILKKYVDRFNKSGYTKIYGIGIGFGGKSCAVKSLGNLLEIS